MIPVMVVVVVLLGLDQFTCDQAEVDKRKVAVAVDLGWWSRSALDLIRISRHFAPLCDGNSNVLSLVKLKSAIAKHDCACILGDFLQHINLFISSSKGDGSCFIAHFDLCQAHAGTVDPILVHHNADLADQSIEANAR